MRTITSTLTACIAAITIIVTPLHVAAAEKIGFVNIEYLLSKLPGSAQMQKDLKGLHGQLQTQIQEKIKSYEEVVKKNKRNELTMSDSQKRDALAEMQAMQREIRQMEQSSQASIQSKRADLMKPLLKKLETAIAEVAKANGYTYVLNSRVNGVSVVLYASIENDISKLVLEHLGVKTSQ